MKIRAMQKMLLGVFFVFLLSGCGVANHFVQPALQDGDEVVGYFVTFSPHELHQAMNGGRLYIEQNDFERRELSGTLYITPQLVNHTLLLSPIYQTNEGLFYIGIGGNSMSMFRETEITAGPLHSSSSTHSHEFMENGRRKTRTTQLTLQVSVMFAPEYIAITQMNETHEVVTTARFIPTTMPDEIILQAETAYIIVEKIHAYPTPVIRHIYNSSDAGFHTFYEAENGVMIQQFTNIN